MREYAPCEWKESFVILQQFQYMHPWRKRKNYLRTAFRINLIRHIKEFQHKIQKL